MTAPPPDWREPLIAVGLTPSELRDGTPCVIDEASIVTIWLDGRWAYAEWCGTFEDGAVRACGVGVYFAVDALAHAVHDKYGDSDDYYAIIDLRDDMWTPEISALFGVSPPPSAPPPVTNDPAPPIDPNGSSFGSDP